ncbi:uncharacterized protein IL334_001020 [Kwoniella shivajii]|uniref:Cyanovirin-N domain-containing protein n=1 Tax=Kwoniella shivajii TaxID=564305 RepID=A0ABZ1CQS4_9TREE|nr:hypothetical protein IL334_001020 [Kwoniella shivajii]
MLSTFFIGIAIFRVVFAQDYFNGTTYNPVRLACAVAEWFDHVSHDPNFIGILRPETDVWYCRYNCDRDGYTLAYWQTSSKMCYCSLEQDIPADQIGEATAVVDGCWSGANARLDDLQADFYDEWCTNSTLHHVPSLTFSSPSILGCIGGCGYPPRVPVKWVYTGVTPRFDETMQEYNYLCQCFNEPVDTYDDAVACGFGKIHWFERFWTDSPA